MFRQALFAVSLAACSSTPALPVTGITVSTGDLVPAFSPNITSYEVTSLTTLVPVTFRITGQDVTIGDVPAKDGVPTDVTIPSLDDTTTIDIHAKRSDGTPITYSLHTPSVRPRYDVTTLSAPVPGQIFLTPFQLVNATGGPAFLYILDETGRLLFYRQTTQGCADFERVKLPNGETRYTYVMQDQPIDPATWPIVPSTAYVLDDHFRVLKTIRLAGSMTHAGGAVDIHQFRLIDDDHWVSVSYVAEVVTNVPNYPSTSVVSGVLQELQSGVVAFDWETTSTPALYSQSVDGNDFTNAKTIYADYNHLNAFDVDPATADFIASLRHADEVVEIDRKTDAVLWTLGGTGDEFGLAGADKFSHQHHVHFLEPNHLIMFDNGNATKLSMIREYQIDPQAHTAQALVALSVDGHFSSAMGSAQKIAGHYFVGWGYRQAGESDVTEIDATTHQKSFELALRDGYISYRALKFQ